MQGINLYMEAVVQDMEFIEQGGSSTNGAQKRGRVAYKVLSTWDYDQISKQAVRVRLK